MKYIFACLLFVISLFCSSQPITIKKHKDVINGHEWYTASRSLKLANSDNTKGYYLDLSINVDLETNIIRCDMWGLGRCSEKNSLIIMFSDSSKIRINSPDKFECQGRCYFDIDKNDEEQLSKKKIIKTRVINNYNSQLYTKSIFDKDQSYFIELFKVINAQRAKLPKKEPELHVEEKEEQKVNVPINNDPVIDTNAVYTVAEQMPQFPGGVSKMMTFIKNNIKYPKEASRMGIEGKVIVSYEVRRDGTLNDIRILKGVGSGCDEEAMRLFEIMPKWEAGMMNGRKVIVKTSTPIKFQLSH